MCRLDADADFGDERESDIPSTQWDSLRSPGVLRGLYNLLAPIYGQLAPFVSSRAHDAALSELDVDDGERVLEIGTGTGRAFERLTSANPAGWTEGIDPTLAMRFWTRRRTRAVSHERYRLRQATVTDLPYPSGHFDAVFSAYVVDLLPLSKLTPALIEIRRVLRSKGRLVLACMGTPQCARGRVWEWIARTVPLALGGSRPVPLTGFLRRAGLHVHGQTRIIQWRFPSTITVATPG